MKRTALVCVSLVVVTLAVFWPVRHQQFINFDDDIYVTDNPHVANGLTLESVRWAFTTTRGTHWWPLTWLSHMLDCQLFGLNAGAHKLVNVAFHIGSTILLFLFLKRVTRNCRATPRRGNLVQQTDARRRVPPNGHGGESDNFWPSAFVAALFAIHPLRVESVAWVAERKDVLSTFFWMLTLWAYSRYVDQLKLQGSRFKVYYGVTLLFFVLGLLAKPMLVTLPVVLLLLDYWPLRRSESRQRLVLEKLPLFMLAAMAAVTTYWVTHSANAVVDIPLDARISNALVSYVRYLGKMIWPQNLALIYPLPVEWPMPRVAAAAALLALISVVAVREATRRPYLIVGWLWYLVTLLPVIGLVQVGMQSMADRFTYVPLVGVYICISWGVADAVAAQPRARLGAAAGAVAAIVGCVIATRVQLRYWKDNLTLFRHTLAVTSGNFIAHGNLGVALSNQGRFEEAVAHLQEALGLASDYARRTNPGLWAYAHNHLGRAYFALGKTNDAVAHLRQAVKLNPRDAAAHNNFGIVLVELGRHDEAIAEFTEAIRLRPDYPLAQANLGGILVDMGRIAEALPHLREALRLKPDFAPAHFQLGEALMRQGNMREAQEHLDIAVRLDPSLAKERRALDDKLRQQKP
jgi:Flp pilus assembly protein TadD